MFNKIPKEIPKKLLFSILILGIPTAIYILPTPLLAQFADVRQHLNSLPTSRVNFAPGTVGTTIVNATNHIYILKAHSGQRLSLKVNSLGGDASITLYGVNGRTLGQLIGGSDEGKELSIELPSTGDYYIVGGAGKANDRYDFTVSIRSEGQ